MRLLPALFALALVGCATTAKFEAKLNTFVGSSETDLVSSFGIPQNVYNVDAGTKILSYRKTGQIVMPGPIYSTPVTTNTTGYVNSQPFNAQSTSYVSQQGAPTVIGLNCTVDFRIVDGYVRAWHWSGNNCTSR